MRTAAVIFMLLLGACTRTEAPVPAARLRVVVVEEDLMEEAVELIKRHEGWHTEKDYPYVGYGHRLLPGESFGKRITERTADSLLRSDLKAKCAVFRHYGRDSLILGVLAYNVGEYRLLGYGGRPKKPSGRKTGKRRPGYQQGISLFSQMAGAGSTFDREAEKGRVRVAVR